MAVTLITVVMAMVVTLAALLEEALVAVEVGAARRRVLTPVTVAALLVTVGAWVVVLVAAGAVS